MSARLTINPGQVFGNWTFIEFAPQRGDKRIARCQCKCGAVQDVYLTHLRTGRSRQCKKCYIVKHDMSNTPTYYTWSSMMRRCYSETSKSYPCYGGRGIVVCAEWHSFEGFLADMGVRPSGATLDRWPDNDGNYEPSNCRWATPKEQANNTSVNVRIEYGGKLYTGAELAQYLGLNRKTLMTRLRAGAQLDAPLHPGVAGGSA